MRALALVIASGVASIGCAEQALLEDMGGGGKGDDLTEDNRDSVSENLTEETLVFETLQRIACDAIAIGRAFDSEADRVALVEQCDDHSFTIVRRLQSVLYQHTNARTPVTMAMDLEVTANGQTFDVVLFRVASRPRLRLVWRGEVENPMDDRTFIEQLARAHGNDLARETAFSFMLNEHPISRLPVGVFDAVSADAEAMSGDLGESVMRIQRVFDDVGYAVRVSTGSGDQVIYYDADGAVVASM